MNSEVLISIFAVVIALASGVVSLLARLDAKKAARAAVDSAEAAARSARADEDLVQIESERREEERATARRAFELSHLAAIAAGQADLQVSVPQNHLLRITNVGEAPARNVVVALDTLQPDQQVPMARDLNCAEIPGGKSHDVLTFGTLQTASKVSVQVSWHDDSGPHLITEPVSLIRYEHG
jgi:hypothetical protein